MQKKDVIKAETQLEARQIQKFFSKTPEHKIYTRPAKGGGKDWKYVKGSYVITVLNSLFGYNWNFEIRTSLSEAFTVSATTESVTVLGRLTCKVGDQEIVKEQFGRADVKYKKGGKEYLDFGNDMKAASMDALKKCASSIGLFADVYAPDDFYDYQIVDDELRDAKVQAKLAKLQETDHED